MASSRPPHEGNLIDLDLNDNVGNSYNPGRRPTISEDEFARRASVSEDAFLNSGPSGPSPYSAPGALPTTHRTRSQTSFNGGYDPYSDINADLRREDSHQSDYYAAGRDEAPDLMGETRGRNSVYSVSGMLDRLTGKKQTYSDMDVPLTETRPRETIAGVEDSSSGSGVARKKESGTFKFGFGRRKVDPSTLGPRVIHLNNPPANATGGYVDNHVSTTKYNIATFLPKFLYEQFSKYANLFFLFTAGLQQIPNISPTNRYTTIGPLIVVLLVSAGKEAIEDWKRRVSDQELNKSKTKVLIGNDFEECEWINVKIGDIVKVESGESFPADLALISTSEPDGLCYIETANLDGETNLKVKQSRTETHMIQDPRELASLAGRIKSEQPNSSLYTYEATLTIERGGMETEWPLAPDQLLLRGAVLRNTGWITGVVVFTGHETKLMRNATATPIKRTAVEAMLNIQIVMLVGILLALSIISSTGDVIKQGVAKTELAYLFLGNNNKAKQFFADILTYWVLYSNLVPISLFVTVEIVKYYHAFLINSDLDIYYEPTDTAAVCRTSSLVEELGQIEYIFSDKTGTLTCNMMEFKQCSIAGIQYGEDIAEDRRAGLGSGDEGVHDFKKLNENLKTHPTRDIMHHFLTLLAICHTVIPEKVMTGPKDNLVATGEIKYQAASPDEGALVEGAADLGYKFTNRTPKFIESEVNGRTIRYDILGVCEFNSTRKRMSIVVRDPDGQVWIYCKGADTVITERLAKHGNPFLDTTNNHLEEYASEGLRTLCLAMRKIPENEFQEWFRVYDAAAKALGNRDEQLDKAAELIERDFTLLGATAIEDRLQDGVPETIHTLQTAGIKIWVLTGDRQETAINIGMSCKLISEDMSLIIVNQDNKYATEQDLRSKLASAKKQYETEEESMALVIDGLSLTFALEEGLDKVFLDLAVMCKAVICCRVSPLQKALVVKLVKRHLKAILLAVGDGANDVSMIQAAHVGVGISGVEGLQAARSADVAIGQFRFLRKLLLVHGAWSYQRISKVILYSFYKNITLYMTQFWYSFQNAFSGQVIYESWTLSFYNVLFTVLPPLVMGIFDQFISARLLDRYPQLYQLGQKGVFFKRSSFWAWLINGFYHSLILYLVSEFIYLYDLPQSDGMMAGHWQWGTSLYTACLATVLGKAALVTNLWTKYTVMAIPGSMLIWMIFLPAYSTAAPMLGFSTEYWGILKRTIESPVFWAMAVVLPALCLVRDFAWKYAKRMYYPQSYHHIQEIQKYNIQDYRPRMEQFQKAIRKVRQVQRMRRQRGYAFSQGDEGQSRILQAYDTTKQRGKYGEMLSVKESQGQGHGHR